MGQWGEPAGGLLPAVGAQSVRDDDLQLPAGPAGPRGMGAAVTAAAPVTISGAGNLAAVHPCPRARGAPPRAPPPQPAAAPRRASSRPLAGPAGDPLPRAL